MQLDSKRRYRPAEIRFGNHRPTEIRSGNPVHYVRTALLCLTMAGSQVLFTMVRLRGDPLQQLQLGFALITLGLAAFAVWQVYKDAREAYRDSGSGAQTLAESREPDAI